MPFTGPSEATPIPAPATVGVAPAPVPPGRNTNRADGSCSM